MKRLQAIAVVPVLLLIAGCCNDAPEPTADDYARHERIFKAEFPKAARKIFGEPLKATVSDEPIEFNYCLLVMSLKGYRDGLWAADNDSATISNGVIRFTENGKPVELTGDWKIRISSNCTKGTKAQVVAH